MDGELWRWQNGSTDFESASAAVVLEDGSVIVGGYTDANCPEETGTTGCWDFAAARISVDGELIWNWQDGTDVLDSFRSIGLGGDGSVVLAGYTMGSWNDDYSDDDLDFAAVKLHSDGSVLWRWQNGSSALDSLHGVAAGSDGSVVLAGGTEGYWNTSSAGIVDMAAVKLDTDGNELWRLQIGTTGEDSFNCSCTVGEDDDSVILAGHTTGSLEGFKATGGWDFAAVKVNSDGTVLWTWQDGTEEDDRVICVAASDNGSVVLGGYTTGDWCDDCGGNAGEMDFAAVKLDADGTEIWRWQAGSIEDDRFYGAAGLEDGSVILSGITKGTWEKDNAGGEDFVVVLLASNGTLLWGYQDGTDKDDFFFGAGSGAGGLAVVSGRTGGNWKGNNAGTFDFAAILLNTSTFTSIVSTTLAPAIAPETVPPEIAPETMAPTRLEPMPSSQENSSTTPRTIEIIGGVLAAAFVGLIAAGLYIRRRKAALSRATKDRDAPSSFETSAIAEDRRETRPPSLMRSSKAVVESPYPRSSSKSGASISSLSMEEGRPRDRPDGKRHMPGAGKRGTYRAESDCNLTTGRPTSDDPPLRSSAGADSSGMTVSVSVAEVARAVASYGNPLAIGVDNENIAEQGLLAVTAETAAMKTLEIRPPDTGTYNGFPAVDESVDKPGDGCSSGDGDAQRALGGERAGRGLGDGGGRMLAGGGRLGIVQAVLGAAQEIAQRSAVPGVSEAANLVVVLVNLAADTMNNPAAVESRARWCRSILLMLERAAEVLVKGKDVHDEAEQILIEDVRDAVADLVQLMQAYRGRNRVSKVFTSSLFQRRQEEAETAINSAILRLQLGLHVQVGQALHSVGRNVDAVGADVKEGLMIKRQYSEISAIEAAARAAHSDWIAARRRSRRRRILDQIEIPPEDVTLTDDVLGRGGFGTVYIADYNGRNAAAKVMQIDTDAIAGDDDDLDEQQRCKRVEDKKKLQRRTFMRELEAMNRLRSPHTVHVYGAITSKMDQFILIMELLPGGDLRKLLKKTKGPLAESCARQIVGDVCAGMTFLHSKFTVHGDLKSANVLFDGEGRAKIADFRTSSWTRHTMSTGLVTYTGQHAQHGRMSLPWAAPEVLTKGSSSYASDVYSFGIVVWEVLSREVPWAGISDIQDLYRVVFFQKQRPQMPADAPAELAEVARVCWATEPSTRPSFKEVMERLQTSDWDKS